MGAEVGQVCIPALASWPTRCGPAAHALSSCSWAVWEMEMEEEGGRSLLTCV